MTDLAKLIERVESASEGSRELSDEVLLACGWERETRHYEMDGVPLSREVFVMPGGEVAASKRPCPTTSVDAALALMPEGWRPEGISWVSHGTNVAGLRGAKDSAAFGFAVSPALAVVAAILRARERRE